MVLILQSLVILVLEVHMKQIFVMFLFICLSFFDAYVYAKNIGEELFNSVIRLHIIADDNSDTAQEIKLKVRDAVLKKIKSEELVSYEAACEYVEKHKQELLDCVYKVLNDANVEYNVSISFEDADFPTKFYDELTFPKGRYRALRILLGDAEGENWWCVMYPALCFSNEVCESTETTRKLKNEISKESFAIVTGEAKFKFKILEFFSN